MLLVFRQNWWQTRTGRSYLHRETTPQGEASNKRTGKTSPNNDFKRVRCDTAKEPLPQENSQHAGRAMNFVHQHTWCLTHGHDPWIIRQGPYFTKWGCLLLEWNLCGLRNSEETPAQSPIRWWPDNDALFLNTCTLYQSTPNRPPWFTQIWIQAHIKGFAKRIPVRTNGSNKIFSIWQTSELHARRQEFSLMSVQHCTLLLFTQPVSENGGSWTATTWHALLSTCSMYGHVALLVPWHHATRFGSTCLRNASPFEILLTNWAPNANMWRISFFFCCCFVFIFFLWWSSCFFFTVGGRPGACANATGRGLVEAGTERESFADMWAPVAFSQKQQWNWYTKL